LNPVLFILCGELFSDGTIVGGLTKLGVIENANFLSFNMQKSILLHSGRRFDTYAKVQRVVKL